jgi:hypothetical protein
MSLLILTLLKDIIKSTLTMGYFLIIEMLFKTNYLKLSLIVSRKLIKLL